MLLNSAQSSLHGVFTPFTLASFSALFSPKCVTVSKKNQAVEIPALFLLLLPVSVA